MTLPDPPNQDQAQVWNDGAGPVWVELKPVLDRMLAPFEETLTDRAFPGADKRVLDIGCGAGATTLAMARHLGPRGHALGVDISQPLVAAAKAAAQGIANADFLVSDAQTHPFQDAAFDAVISRMGVMFFDDPVAAFANIRRAAAPGARLSFICWRSREENPFFTAAARALGPFMPPTPPPDPRAPGQFAFAEEAYVRQILGDAGWRDITFEPLDVPQSLPAQLLPTFAAKMGPAKAALEALDEATRAKALEALLSAFSGFIEGDQVRTSAACWWVEGER